MKPRISVLLPALRGYEAARGAIESWERQGARECLEILVLCSDELATLADEGRRLPPGHVIVPVGGASLHQARAIGVTRARGEYVMLAEDHCLPEPGWVEAIVDRLEEGWDGIGSVMRPANGESRWAEASFLIGYGEWMLPAAGGPTPVLCGLNGTIRTTLLRGRGSALASELLIGAVLMQRLGQSGCRFHLEGRARMLHFDPATASFAITSLAALGLGFGAMRTRGWAWPLRGLYALAAPAVAVLHGRRALRQYRRAGGRSELRRSAPVFAMVLAVAWAGGEAVGAVLGLSAVEPYVSRAETRPVTREQIERALSRTSVLAGHEQFRSREDRND